MNNDHPPIRPPSEAHSTLLRITEGCSYNGCTFCPAYKNIPFTIRSAKQIKQTLLSIASGHRASKRLFLCDGDALTVPQDRLTETMAMIHQILPEVKSIRTYANAKSVSTKSDEQLRTLRQDGLKVVHMGLESGDDVTLKRLNKWGTAQEIITQAKRLRQVRIKLFVTVLLGAGGTQRSDQHARFTADALSQIDPEYIGALTLMPYRGTPLYEQCANGTFTLPSPKALLGELKTVLENLTLSRGLFFANHASNYLPLNVRLPGGKDQALKLIEHALGDQSALKPEWMRGL